MIKEEVKKVKTGFKKLAAFRKACYEFAKEYSNYLQAYNYLLSGRFDLANIEPAEYKIEAFAHSKLYDEYKKRFEELYIKKLEHSNGNVTPGILTPKFTVSEYLNEITLLRHEMLYIFCSSIEQGKKEGTIKPDVNSVEVTVLLTLITTNIDNMPNDLKDLLIIQGIHHNKFLADVNDFIDNIIGNNQK